ncbi:MAG: universal stress protein [Vicinamibacterales bacterium]
MNVRPSILCPVDFSDASAGALRYAAAIAEHFVTRLIVLTVENPLLRPEMDFSAVGYWGTSLSGLEASDRELEAFVSDAFHGDADRLAMCEYDLAVGNVPNEILRVARERSCDLIVMSSHGETGARKLLFGSTTERVLRQAHVPVLVTPPVCPEAIHLEDVRRVLGGIVVPVDLSPASPHQTRVAGGLAAALQVPLALVHVIEPQKSRLFSHSRLAAVIDASRRASVDHELQELCATLPPQVAPDTLVAVGDPAEEAAKVVRERRAGLVVMGLHGSLHGRPRMGSVTYRLLCMAPALVLALPPKVTDAPARTLDRVIATPVAAHP